ncbi:hypothetical protein ACFQPA_02350 [Halomarina halobia]|uniref:DUF7344 domain-containing protein n=1 Tax=Halomarina halobia TaxID=3033386 RepID=A0ABD6A4E4_9EURY|nr:hypothetical protein [Halomarina sp. PSR21]
MKVKQIERSVDTHLRLLSNRRRRYALACLQEYGPSIALADLADEVAVREHDAPLPAIDERAVLDVYMSLYHSHVPKFVDAGIVEYDQERDLVRIEGVPPLLERLFGVVEQDDRP